MNKRIEINFEDGSFVAFNYASVIDLGAYGVSVWTEHCGRHKFPVRISQVTILEIPV